MLETHLLDISKVVLTPVCNPYGCNGGFTGYGYGYGYGDSCCA